MLRPRVPASPGRSIAPLFASTNTRIRHRYHFKQGVNGTTSRPSWWSVKTSGPHCQRQSEFLDVPLKIVHVLGKIMSLKHTGALQLSGTLLGKISRKHQTREQKSSLTLFCCVLQFRRGHTSHKE